ncbi:MAG TPA: DUF4131 domain-containing protein, partial [Candidatus Thioglobus sp.]|nr:DUF4131 domain-containing protein [Candidatus Thioglobus sp.]
MVFFALNFLLGIMVFSVKNTLSLSTPEISLIFILILVILATFKRQKPIAMSLVFFILGFGWMGLFSIHALQANIDEKYFNTSINVVGTIADIPKISKHKTQFIFNVIEPFNATIKL